MDIFISYATRDEELAVVLKKELENNNAINNVFIAQQSLDFNVDISEKITNEIEKSNFVIALITKKSKNSLSVGQEIGYAYGKTPTITLIEEKSNSGVLLTGRDKFEFNEQNFKEKINEVIKYIMEYDFESFTNDVTPKLLRKSAHYRKTLKRHIQCLLDSLYYRFNISEKHLSSAYDMCNKSYLQMIDDFFKNEYKSKKTHILNISFEQITKLNSGLMIVKQEINEEKAPNNEFPQDEHDLIIELLKEINCINRDDYWNVEEYSKYGTSPSLCFKHKAFNSKYEIFNLNQGIMFLYIDVRKIAIFLLKLSKIYCKYDKEFPDTAFK